MNDEIRAVSEQLEFLTNGTAGEVEAPFIRMTDALAIEEPEVDPLPAVFSSNKN